MAPVTGTGPPQAASETAVIAGASCSGIASAARPAAWQALARLPREPRVLGWSGPSTRLASSSRGWPTAMA